MSYFEINGLAVFTPPPFPPPPLLPPPIHEPTAESMFNDFFPKKVDNAELLQALLGIHEELRGIRKALETK